MRNIKQVKADLAKLREEYEAATTLLEKEIVAIRAGRGYVPVVRTYEPMYEQGRSMEPGQR